MKKALVSLDGSKAGRAAVEWCAEHLEASTSVIAVCGISELGEFVLGIPPFDEPSSEARIEASVNDDWTAPLRRAGLACEPRMVHGRQAAALCQVAADEQPDVLIMGEPRHFGILSGHGGLKKLMRRVRCPIVLVPAQVGERGHRKGTVLADRQGRPLRNQGPVTPGGG